MFIISNYLKLVYTQYIANIRKAYTYTKVLIVNITTKLGILNYVYVKYIYSLYLANCYKQFYIFNLC